MILKDVILAPGLFAKDDKKKKKKRSKPYTGDTRAGKHHRRPAPGDKGRVKRKPGEKSGLEKENERQQQKCSKCGKERLNHDNSKCKNPRYR